MSLRNTKNNPKILISEANDSAVDSESEVIIPKNRFISLIKGFGESKKNAFEIETELRAENDVLKQKISHLDVVYNKQKHLIMDLKHQNETMKNSVENYKQSHKDDNFLDEQIKILCDDDSMIKKKEDIIRQKISLRKKELEDFKNQYS